MLQVTSQNSLVFSFTHVKTSYDLENESSVKGDDCQRYFEGMSGLIYLALTESMFAAE